jgi:ABC-type bacteriocin/lantibiotic exporter with double-glycine peptidase domain
MSAYGFVQSTVATAAGGLVLAAGGALVAGGAMTLGALIAFYVVLGLLQGQAGLIFNTVPQVIAGAEALLGLYQLQHEPAGPPYTGGECITLRGEITLQAVAFHYRRQAVLHGVDLALRPGEVTAIVGPNGAGKSTLVNLMLGFYRPQAGALLADGVPYDRLDLPHLRRQIGVVMQEALLFPGTVWDNLTYGFEDAAPETVERAAEWAAASELLRSLPEGYATPVGEHGVLLSGGQRQRLAIARALLREPRLLILDEPTNHLDAATVDTVMGNLRRLPQRPAILLISHDPGVVRGADRVYHLREGRLAPAEG